MTLRELSADEKTSVANLLIARNASNVSTHSPDIAHTDLRFLRDIISLRGLHFAGMHMPGVDLSCLDLSRCDFGGANIDGANLAGSTLIQTRFDRASAIGAKFNGCVMENASFVFARIKGADFRGASYLCALDMVRASWSSLRSDHENDAELIARMMRFDADHHPEGNAPFERWADGGSCPYGGGSIRRPLHFGENGYVWRDHGVSNMPAQNAHLLMVDLFRRYDIRSDWNATSLSGLSNDEIESIAENVLVLRVLHGGGVAHHDSGQANRPGRLELDSAKSIIGELTEELDRREAKVNEQLGNGDIDYDDSGDEIDQAARFRAFRMILRRAIEHRTNRTNPTVRDDI